MTEAPLDLLVVGGGVLGTTVAVLAKLDRPEWTVRLVEQGRVGQGATGASAGLSFPIARSAWQATLVRASEQGYARLAEYVSNLPVYDIDVLWVLGEDQVPKLANRMVDSPPVPASESQRAALWNAYPDFTIGPDEVVMSTAKQCFYAYPALLTHRLADWLVSIDPTAVCEGVGVERIEGQTAATWDVRLSDGRRLQARRVVTAVGPWLGGDLLPKSTLTPNLQVKKVAALHLAHQPPADAPCVMLWENDAFVLPVAERGHCLLSYRNTTWGVDPEQHMSLTRDDVSNALSVLRTRSTDLAGKYVGGQAFCDAYTADLVPRVEQHPGLAEVGGCSGSGVRLAPGLAAVTLDAVSSLDVL